MKAEDSQTVDTSGGSAGRNPVSAEAGAEVDAATRRRTKAESSGLMEAVVEPSNLWLAYERVMTNKGAPGVDGPVG